VVGGWLQIHQLEVFPPYFAARKKNLGTGNKVEDTLPASDVFLQPTETPILSILNTQN
jgi:hypothetical protein